MNFPYAEVQLVLSSSLDSICYAVKQRVGEGRLGSLTAWSVLAPQ